jgi:hypothetical protein
MAMATSTSMATWLLSSEPHTARSVDTSRTLTHSQPLSIVARAIIWCGNNVAAWSEIGRGAAPSSTDFWNAAVPPGTRARTRRAEDTTADPSLALAPFRGPLVRADVHCGNAHVGGSLPEYKDEAVQLVINTGRSVATVAPKLGIRESTLGRWVHDFEGRAAAGEAGQVA